MQSCVPYHVVHKIMIKEKNLVHLNESQISKAHQNEAKKEKVKALSCQRLWNRTSQASKNFRKIK